MTIAFTVPAIPIAQPRQRHAMIGGHVRNYTPADSPVNSFKASCRLALREVHSGAPLKGPLFVQINFVMPRPSNLIWKKRPMPRLEHAKRPDIDNLCKAIFDALCGLCWIDDAQISQLITSKSIAAGDEQPHVHIVIDEIGAVNNA